MHRMAEYTSSVHGSKSLLVSDGGQQNTYTRSSASCCLSSFGALENNPRKLVPDFLEHLSLFYGRRDNYQYLSSWNAWYRRPFSNLYLSIDDFRDVVSLSLVLSLVSALTVIARLLTQKSTYDAA